MKREDILKVYEAGPDAVVSLVQELFQLLEQQRIIIEQQAVEIRNLKERVKTLENQLNKNSRNSGKPPSSDGLKKPQPKPKSLRTSSGRSPGAQPGHSGNTLKFSTQPDQVTLHAAPTLCSCGQSLEHVAPQSHDARQVYDLPPIRVHVTEHRVEVKCCPVCQTTNKGQFPHGVTAPVQYGQHVRGMVSYLNQYQLLPYERITELARDLFSHSLSPGFIVNANADLSHHLESVEQDIIQHLASSPVIHCDESGMRIEGKTQWCHVASTENVTYYFPHEKRGQEGMISAQVLPQFQGTAVHDFWAPYARFACHHALCNAHILRELIFVLEEEKQHWAKPMINLLLEGKELKASQGHLDAQTVSDFAQRYDRIVELGFLEDAQRNPPVALPSRTRGRTKQSKPKNLLDRLHNHKLDILAFLCEKHIPFDNNQAERDIRMLKVHQKISGTFRSARGAEVFCRIRSYISTVKKHSLPILDALYDALRGQPFTPSPRLT